MRRSLWAVMPPCTPGCSRCCSTQPSWTRGDAAASAGTPGFLQASAAEPADPAVRHRRRTAARPTGRLGPGPGSAMRLGQRRRWRRDCGSRNVGRPAAPSGRRPKPSAAPKLAWSRPGDLCAPVAARAPGAGAPEPPACRPAPRSMPGLNDWSPYVIMERVQGYYPRACAGLPLPGRASVRSSCSSRCRLHAHRHLLECTTSAGNVLVAPKARSEAAGSASPGAGPAGVRLNRPPRLGSNLTPATPAPSSCAGGPSPRPPTSLAPAFCSTSLLTGRRRMGATHRQRPPLIQAALCTKRRHPPSTLDAPDGDARIVRLRDPSWRTTSTTSAPRPPGSSPNTVMPRYGTLRSTCAPTWPAAVSAARPPTWRGAFVVPSPSGRGLGRHRPCWLVLGLGGAVADHGSPAGPGRAEHRFTRLRAVAPDGVRLPRPDRQSLPGAWPRGPCSGRAQMHGRPGRAGLTGRLALMARAAGRENYSHRRLQGDGFAPSAENLQASRATSARPWPGAYYLDNTASADPPPARGRRGMRGPCHPWPCAPASSPRQGRAGRRRQLDEEACASPAGDNHAGQLASVLGRLGLLWAATRCRHSSVT